MCCCFSQRRGADTFYGSTHSSSGFKITIRFPGQWFLAENGLHQNWMREYGPTTGRYLQADPIGLNAGCSLYGYALQNPSVHIDPTGENPIAWGIARYLFGRMSAAIVRGSSVPRSPLGVGIGAGMISISPTTLEDGTSGAQARDEATSESGMCEGGDECAFNRDQCYLRKLADRDGAVWGESRCQQCYRQCDRDGMWSKRVEGTYKSCDWKRSPRTKLWSLLP